MARSSEGFLKSKLVVFLLWLSFIALWGRVYQITTLKDVTDSLYYLVNLTAVYGVVVALWVIHNVRIYRAKGPRLRPRWIGFSDTHDCLNHHINREVDVEREQQIVVEVIQTEKFFLAPSSSANEPELTTKSR